MSIRRTAFILVIAAVFSLSFYLSSTGAYDLTAIPDIFEEWDCSDGLECITDDCGTYKKVANSDYELTFNADPGIYECEMEVKSCCYGFTGTVPETNEYVDIYLNNDLVGSTDDLQCNDPPSENGGDPDPEGPCISVSDSGGNAVISGSGKHAFPGNSFCFTVSNVAAAQDTWARRPLMVLAGNNDRNYLIVRYRVEGTTDKVEVRSGFCFRCSDYGYSWCEIRDAWLNLVSGHKYKVVINGCNIYFEDTNTGDSYTKRPVKADFCPGIYNSLDLEQYCTNNDNNCDFHGSYRWVDESIGFSLDLGCSGGVEPPECDKNNPCPDGEVCVDNTCIII